MYSLLIILNPVSPLSDYSCITLELVIFSQIILLTHYAIATLTISIIIPVLQFLTHLF